MDANIRGLVAEGGEAETIAVGGICEVNLDGSGGELAVDTMRKRAACLVDVLSNAGSRKDKAATLREADVR